MQLELNRPLENPRLKELFALRREAEDGEMLRPIMEKLLSELVMNASLLSMVRLSQNSGTGEEACECSPETTIGFPMLTAPDGRQFYAAFIDEEELGEWNSLKESGLQTICLNFDEYAYMVLDQQQAEGLVINPFSDNLSLDRNGLRELRERKELQTTGHARKQVEKNAVVHLGDPEEYPEEMVEAICSYAEAEPGIRRLWLRMMEQNGELSYLLVAELSGETEALFEQIAVAAAPYLGEMFIDMLPLSDGFAQRAIEGTSAFYRRKS